LRFLRLLLRVVIVGLFLVTAAWGAAFAFAWWIDNPNLSAFRNLAEGSPRSEARRVLGEPHAVDSDAVSWSGHQEAWTFNWSPGYVVYAFFGADGRYEGDATQ
jgi:hypothetical protein